MNRYILIYTFWTIDYLELRYIPIKTNKSKEEVLNEFIQTIFKRDCGLIDGIENDYFVFYKNVISITLRNENPNYSHNYHPEVHELDFWFDNFEKITERVFETALTNQYDGDYE